MITGWFARLIAVLAILGVFAFDGFSVLASHFSAADDAQTAAQAAADQYKLVPNVAAAVQAAQLALHKGDVLVPGSFQIAATGEVTLKIKRTAYSLLLNLTSQTKKWAVVTEDGSADPPS